MTNPLNPSLNPPPANPWARAAGVVRYPAALAACLAGTPLWAGGLGVGIEIPRLDVAEYHRPYVAAWIERADAGSGAAPATALVWYAAKMKNDEGQKWLKDLRQWWRRAGRDLSLPIDGVSGPTRPAGRHQVQLTEGARPLGTLAPGAYKLVVEAVREVGGREVVTVPFNWPAAQAQQLRAQGSSELGEVTLDLKP